MGGPDDGYDVGKGYGDDCDEGVLLFRRKLKRALC